MKTLKEEQDKADLEQLRAEMAEKRAKQADTSEHNTEYKATPSAPDNRAKTKKQNRSFTEEKSWHITTSSTNAYRKSRKNKNNNPESEHEPKGKPGRPRNNQGPKPNTQGPPPVRKDSMNKPNPIPTPNPKHDTDIDNNTYFKF